MAPTVAEPLSWIEISICAAEVGTTCTGSVKVRDCAEREGKIPGSVKRMNSETKHRIITKSYYLWITHLI